MKNTTGYSELTDRILIGKANEEKGIWIGKKEDITNTFLNICFQYFPEGEVREIESPNLNKTNMFFNVKRDKESIEKTIKYLQKELNNFLIRN